MTKAEALQALGLTEGDAVTGEEAECCAGEIGDIRVLDLAGVTYFGIVQFLLDALGFCACGDPEAVAKLIFSYMERITTHVADGEWVDLLDGRYPNEVAYLVLYNLDRVGLTTHGGSVGGSWFEHKGWAFYTLIRDARPQWATT